MLKRALCFSCLMVVARLTISFHFLALGSKSLLIPVKDPDAYRLRVMKRRNRRTANLPAHHILATDKSTILRRSTSVDDMLSFRLGVLIRARWHAIFNHVRLIVIRIYIGR